MKKIEYTCDKCKRLLLDPNKYNLTLGSESGDLYYKRGRENKELGTIELNRHKELHFCNKECFVNYFFFTEKQIQEYNKSNP